MLDPADLEPLEETVTALRARLAHPDDILLVALAGGTGSGKSSLLNALVGADLADVGGVRPTTAVPLAAVPVEGGDRLDALLDTLGIDSRQSHDVGGLCLIDMPDNDSVEVSHRHRVDALLPLVDVVVWVTDPEKYRDARLHEGYLRPLAAYAPQFVVALNRSDRLAPGQLAEVTEDLIAALAEDGLSEVPVAAVAASPPSGPPIGVEELHRLLEAKLVRPDTLYGKLLTDLETAARVLEEAVGEPVDFDRRAAESLEMATDALVGGDVAVAVGQLTGFLDDMTGLVGGRTGDAITRLAADVPGHVARISGEVAGEPRRRGWLRRSEVGPPEREDVRARINQAIIHPARALVARRALAQAAVAELGVELAGIRSETAR